MSQIINEIATQNEIASYLEQLTPAEKIVLNIAKEHLESSFSLTKSMGFQEWLEKHRKENIEKVINIKMGYLLAKL